MTNPKGSGNDKNLPSTPNEDSYREGYSQGRAGNEEVQYERERAAVNNGAVNGLAIGGTIAALLGLGALTLYYVNQPLNPAPTTIISIPPSPTASITPKPTQETKIIERTIEKAVPGPATTTVIQVPKPVLVPGETKTIVVPKPVLVPGETKIIEAPKRSDVPASLKPTTSALPKVSASPGSPSNTRNIDSSNSPSPDPNNN